MILTAVAAVALVIAVFAELLLLLFVVLDVYQRAWTGIPYDVLFAALTGLVAWAAYRRLRRR